MHIRYVEDARADVLALKWMFRNKSNIRLSSCERIDEIAWTAAETPIDILLIDILRPDAISPESDVGIARKFTDAPILFLTGMNCEEVRDRVLRAGADAVISKDATSPEMICQFAENALARARLLPPAVLSSEDMLDELPPDVLDGCEPNATIASVDAALAYLERGLADLAAPLGDVRAHYGLASDMFAMARRIRHLGRRDFARCEECDLADLVDDLAPALGNVADDLGITLSLRTLPPAPFLAIGSRAHARLGIEAILLGLMHCCEPGCRLQIDARSDGDQAQISVSGDRGLLANSRVFFLPETVVPANLHYGIASLQCGARLLALRQEQIRIERELPYRVHIYL
jgi:DNA-binding NarL/FixJ family response regulator